MTIDIRTIAYHLVSAVLLVTSVTCASVIAGTAPLYSNSTGDQKRNDGTTWKVTVTETERQARYSVIQVATEGRLPSVGSSVFIACSVLNLARERGFRYVAQLGDSGTMKIGFLDRLEDDPVKVVGVDFTGLAPARKYDAEKYAPICGSSKADDPAQSKAP